MKKIIITLPVDETDKKRFEAVAQGFELSFIELKDVKQTDVDGACAVIGNVKPELIKKAKALEWLQLNSAGTDGYTPLAKEMGFKLTNSTGAFGLAISEHVLAVTLALLKKLNKYEENRRLGVWRDMGEVKSIYGSVVLILGAGDIGMSAARLYKAFGAYVIAVQRSPGEKPDFVNEIHSSEKTDELIKRADIILAALPATSETYRMINRQRLSEMKKTAVIINVGRGNLIDTEALCDALHEGIIAGAALDVTDPEPLPDGHRLYSAPNIIITPHVSGGAHLPETLVRIKKIAAENLARFCKGEELINNVDLKTGYREKQ